MRCRELPQRSTEVTREHPVLVDRFLDDAVEIDVDALFDGHDMYVAGVWSTSKRRYPLGDSRVLCHPWPRGIGHRPHPNVDTSHRARRGGVGLLNVQFALAQDTLVLEANPRAFGRCRSSPKPPVFPWRRRRLASWRVRPSRNFATRACFPVRVMEVPCLRAVPFLSRKPSCRSDDSTGRCGSRTRDALDGRGHGHRRFLRGRFAKSQQAYAGSLPTRGAAFVSLANRDKRA